MSFDSKHPGGSLEERAAWDAFVRDAYAANLRAGGGGENLTAVLSAADRMIEHRRAKFPAKPVR